MTGPLIPPRFGAREAMPLKGFLDQSRQFDLDEMLKGVGVTPERMAELKAARAQVAAQAAEIADRYPAFVEWICDISLRKPALVFGLGADRDTFIAQREGENALAWRIVQAIAEGRGEPPPVREF